MSSEDITDLSSLPRVDHPVNDEMLAIGITKKEWDSRVATELDETNRFFKRIAIGAISLVVCGFVLGVILGYMIWG